MQLSRRWRWGLVAACVLSAVAVFGAFPPSEAGASGEWLPGRLWRQLTGSNTRVVCMQNISSVAITGPNFRQAAQGGAPAPVGNPSRNLVNLVDKNIADDWTAEEGKFQNIRWAVDAGGRGYVAPVIVGGRVFVSTNGGKKAVLLCLS